MTFQRLRMLVRFITCFLILLAVAVQRNGSIFGHDVSVTTNDTTEQAAVVNSKDYLKTFLMESAHKALEAGFVIPDTIGVELYKEPHPMMGAGRGAPSFGPGRRPMFDGRYHSQSLA